MDKSVERLDYFIHNKLRMSAAGPPVWSPPSPSDPSARSSNQQASQVMPWCPGHETETGVLCRVSTIHQSVASRIALTAHRDSEMSPAVRKTPSFPRLTWEWRWVPAAKEPGPQEGRLPRPSGYWVGLSLSLAGPRPSVPPPRQAVATLCNCFGRLTGVLWISSWEEQGAIWPNTGGSRGVAQPLIGRGPPPLIIVLKILSLRIVVAFRVLFKGKLFELETQFKKVL